MKTETNNNFSLKNDIRDNVDSPMTTGVLQKAHANIVLTSNEAYYPEPLYYFIHQRITLQKHI